MVSPAPADLQSAVMARSAASESQASIALKNAVLASWGLGSFPSSADRKIQSPSLISSWAWAAIMSLPSYRVGPPNEEQR